MNDDKKFTYSYSAPTEDERREIDDIKREYLPKSESKLDKLKKLDAKVKRLPKIASIITGVAGILVFGLGLTMVLEWQIYVDGVIVAGLGALLMCAAYPLYLSLYGYGKRKYGAEIVKLSDELISGKTDGGNETESHENETETDGK